MLYIRKRIAATRIPLNKYDRYVVSTDVFRKFLCGLHLLEAYGHLDLRSENDSIQRLKGSL
jgi:hypothetical protein